MEFGGIMSKYGIFGNIGIPVRPIRFCPENCHVGGRLIAAPTFGACNVGGRVPPNYRRKNFGAPTMQYRTFVNEIRRYNIEMWRIAARCAARFPMGIAGRMISVELWCDRPRRSLDFDSLRGAPPLHGVSFEISFLQKCGSPFLRIMAALS